MALTHVFLFFLVLGALCFFAGAAVAGTLQLAAIRHEQPGETYAFLRLAPVGATLVLIGALLTFGFGIALVQHEGINFSTAWIQAALGLLVTSIALGAYGGRTARHARSVARRLAADGEASSQELPSLIGARAPLWASWASGLLLLGVLGLSVWQPTGSATPAYAPSTVVPASVQRAIAHKFPQFTYLPTRLPGRLHYTSYDGLGGFEFTMWFSGSDGTSAPLEYGVTVADCGAQPSSAQSFIVNNVDVSWSGDYTSQHAWRCITDGPTSITVSASRSVEGDANPLAGNRLTPKQHRDALELAQVVAYAEPIR